MKKEDVIQHEPLGSLGSAMAITKSPPLTGLQGAQGDTSYGEIMDVYKRALLEVNNRVDDLQKRLREEQDKVTTLNNRLTYEQDTRQARMAVFGHATILFVVLWLIGTVVGLMVDSESLLPGGDWNWIVGPTKTLGTVAFVTFMVYLGT